MKADKKDLVRIMGEKKHRAAAWMMTKSCFLWLPLLLLLIASGPYRWFGTLAVAAVATDDDEPTPKPWPPQFHSILMVNFSGNLSQIDLWYDWPNGRNFNIIQDQLAGERLYDLEWNNGTSFFYKLESDYCRSVQLEIGILRPNWLDGANYLGQRHVDGFLCNVWEKVDFIWYYEDVVTNKPVHWRFYTGKSSLYLMKKNIDQGRTEPCQTRREVPRYSLRIDLNLRWEIGIASSSVHRKSVKTQWSLASAVRLEQPWELGA